MKSKRLLSTLLACFTVALLLPVVTFADVHAPASGSALLVTDSKGEIVFNVNVNSNTVTADDLTRALWYVDVEPEDEVAISRAIVCCIADPPTRQLTAYYHFPSGTSCSVSRSFWRQCLLCGAVITQTPPVFITTHTVGDGAYACPF